VRRPWRPAIAPLVLLAAVGCGSQEPEVGAPRQDPTTSTSTARLTADDIAVAHTPAGGWTEPPEPVLTGCAEPLVEGAPDMRGVWRAVSATRNGAPVPDGDRALSNVQRIEQCGDRVTITSGGIIHDMRADGSVERGVHDVAERDFTTPITVVATYEDGVHVLRPVGIDVEITRRLDGQLLVWNYLGTEITLERIGGPDDPFPGPDDDEEA
jgi:hypothetical protein